MKILIPGTPGMAHVSAERIIRIQSLNNYSKIFLEGQKPIVVSKVLLWFENQLPATMFVRVHRSHLVNRNYVHEVYVDQQSSLLLSNGEVVHISRRKKSALKNWQPPCSLAS